MPNRAYRSLDAKTRQKSHFPDDIADTRKRQGRRSKQFFIQTHKFFIDASGLTLAFAFSISNQKSGELFKLKREREQNDSREKTERRMRVRDASGGNPRVPNGVERAGTMENHQGDDNQGGSCDIKKNMNQTCPLRIRL